MATEIGICPVYASPAPVHAHSCFRSSRRRRLVVVGASVVVIVVVFLVVIVVVVVAGGVSLLFGEAAGSGEENGGLLVRKGPLAIVEEMSDFDREDEACGKEPTSREKMPARDSVRGRGVERGEE